MIFDTLRVVLLHILLPLMTLYPQATLSIGVTGQPITFLPHAVSTDSEKIVSNLLFRRLFEYTDGELQNDLIDTWSANESNTEFTLKLKEDVFWQDGAAISSDDILHTLTLRKNLRDEIEIEKISEKEVIVRLPTPNAILPALLTFGLEPAHLKNQSPLNPIGSTSFHIARIIRERDTIQGIILQSFEKDKQYQRIAIRFYEGDNDLKTAYELGEIIAFFSNTQFTHEGVQSIPISYLGRYFALVYNTESPHLLDPDMRKKLASVLDVNALLERNYYTNSIIAQGPIGYHPNTYTKDIYLIDTYSEETELTQTEIDLLSPLVIVLPNNNDGRQIESFVREAWETRLGVDLEVQYTELNELIERGKDGDFDVMFVGHEVTPDPDRYTFWHSTQSRGGLNFSRFIDLRADKALEEGRHTAKQDERIRHYDIFQDVMATKVPAIFLYHPGQYFYISDHHPLSMPKVLYYPSDIIQNL